MKQEFRAYIYLRNIGNENLNLNGIPKRKFPNFVQMTHQYDMFETTKIQENFPDSELIEQIKRI